MKSLATLCLLTALAAGAAAEETLAPTSTEAEARTALERALAFLLRDQNANGSWGGPRDSLFTFGGGFWSNPEAHRSWSVATTGLCTLALLAASETAEINGALRRATAYLCDNTDLKRPSGFEVWHNWGFIYGLQALAAVSRDPRFADDATRRRVLKAAAEMHDGLVEWQSCDGGWGYLDTEPSTKTPKRSMSFMTAAAIVALEDAQEAGVQVDETMFSRALRALRRCRLSDGSYTYTVDAIPSHWSSTSINTIKGSLGRTLLGDWALKRAGDDIPEKYFEKEFENLFEHHRFLDCALYRPHPHEAYYANSGYFYLWAHYYAAMVLRRMPEATQARWRGRLWGEVIKTQAPDGGMWDYGMHAYHKPYGSAYGALALLQTLPAADPGKSDVRTP